MLTSLILPSRRLSEEREKKMSTSFVVLGNGAIGEIEYTVVSSSKYKIGPLSAAHAQTSQS